MFNKYKGIIIITGVLVAMTIFVVGAIKPTIDSIFTTKENLENKKARIVALSTKEELLKSVSKEQLASEVKVLTDALPSVVDLSVIVATLQKVATDAEIELGEFSISSNTPAVTVLPIEQAEKLSSFQFRVNLVGDFEKIKRFDEMLGTVAPMLRMESLDFGTAKSQAMINFYFQPQSAAKPKVDEPLAVLSERHRKVIDEIGRLTPPILEEVIATPSEEQSNRQNPFR